MHIVRVNPGPFEDRDDLRQYIMSEAFGAGPAKVSVFRPESAQFDSDLPVLRRIFSIPGVIQARSELRDITRSGVDTLVIRISSALTWESVEPELHRVLESFKPVQV